MKFLNLFTFAVAVSATPMPGFEVSNESTKALEARQGSNLASVVVSAVNAATSAINTSLNSIDTTLASAGGAVTANVQAAIQANLQQIAAALGNGTDAITGAIAGAGGNIGNAVAGFSAAQIAQLVQATNQLVTLLTNLGARLTVIINGLDGVAPAVLANLQAEFDAINAAVQPFVGPIGNIVEAVRKLSVFASASLSGFGAVVPGLVNIINNVINGS